MLNYDCYVKNVTLFNALSNLKLLCTLHYCDNSVSETGMVLERTASMRLPNRLQIIYAWLIEVINSLQSYDFIKLTDLMGSYPTYANDLNWLSTNVGLSFTFTEDSYVSYKQ